MQLSLPRLGNERQKRTRSAVVQKLAQQAASKRNLGRFAKLGTGAGSRTMAPFQGARAASILAAASRGRPNLLANRGLGRVGEMMEMRGGGGPAIHVQPPAALPTDYLTPDVPEQGGGSPFGGLVRGPQAGAAPGGPSVGGQPTAPWSGFGGETGSPTNPAQVMDSGSIFEGALPSYSQQAPSSPLTIGGLIPLGGGLFLNPETGALHGGGLL